MQGSKINRPDVPGPADFDVGTAKILTAVPDRDCVQIVAT